MELGDVSDALALAVCGVRCGARPYVIGHPGPCARVSPSGLPFDIALVSAMLSTFRRLGDWGWRRFAGGWLGARAHSGPAG